MEGMEMEADFSDATTVVMTREEDGDSGASIPATSTGLGAAAGGLAPPPLEHPTPRLPRPSKYSGSLKQFLEDVEETRRIREGEVPRAAPTKPPTPRTPSLQATAAAGSVSRATAPNPRSAAPTPRRAAAIPRAAASVPRAAAPIPRAAAPIPRAAVRPPFRISRQPPRPAAASEGLAMPFVMVRSAKDLLDVMRPITAPAPAPKFVRSQAQEGTRQPIKKRLTAPGKRRCFICKEKGHEAKNYLVQRPPRQN